MANSTDTRTQNHSQHIIPSVNIVPAPPSSEDETWVFSNHPDPPVNGRGHPPPHIAHILPTVLAVPLEAPPVQDAVRPHVRLPHGWGERFDHGTGILVQGARALLRRWPVRRFARWLGAGAAEDQQVPDVGNQNTVEPTPYRHSDDAVIAVRKPAFRR